MSRWWWTWCVVVVSSCWCVPEGRRALETATCDPGCDLFEACLAKPSGAECSITCEADSDCSSGCCAPLQGRPGTACAFDAEACPDLAESGGGGSAGTGAGTSGAGGGTTSGGGASCSTVPRTYINDVQFDSICAAAVCYQRTGNTAGVQASCRSLSGLSGPSPSQCPACR